MYSSSSMIQGTTNFGIHKCDVPITILPPPRPHTQSNPNLSQSVINLQQNASDTRSDLLPPECSTSGRTTTFDVHLPAQSNVEVFEAMPGQTTSNGLPGSTNRPLRIAQPPQSLHNSLLMKPRHSVTPSTSSLNSNTTTTFPACTNPPSTSSLPVFQSPPAGGVRRPTASNSTLPAYNTFSTSTLPNRRFPQPSNDPRHSYNMATATNSMSRGDLMELAKRRQQQIEANEDFIEELQKQQHALLLAKRNGLNVQTEVDRLKEEIRRDEQTLQKLGSTKRDCMQTRQDAQNQRQVLQSLQNESHAKDVELRQAAGKLHLLQKQRDLMHQRRQAAENAALAQQERLNAMQRGQPLVEELYGEVRKPQRPKASVVPFQVQRQAPQIQSPQTTEKRKPPSYDEIDAVRNFNRVVMRPHVQGKYSSTSINHQPYNNQNANDNNSPWVLRTSAVDTFILRNDSLKAAKRRSWAHVEQQSTPNTTSTAPISTKTQPAPSAPTSSKQEIPTQQQQAISQADRPQKKQRKSNNLLSSLFGRKKDSTSTKQKATVAPIKEASNKEVELPKQAPLIEKPVEHEKQVTSLVEETKEEKDELPRTEPTTEQIEVRIEEPIKEEEVLPDPPAPTTQFDKTPTPKLEVQPVCATSPLSVKVPNRMESVSPPEDPQQEKERCESPASSVESNQEEKPMTNDEKKMLEATNKIMRQLNALEVDTVRVISAPKARLDSDDDLEDEDESDAESDTDLYRMQHDVLIQPYEHHLDDYGDEEQQTTTEEASSNDGETSSVEEPQFEEIMRPELRSCLKAAGVEKPKRKMVFDPWIIFLNAALEGQLDLVKENAQKIQDVSQANEEGITALHNAICAGHYDIVRYLVAEHADVNAQDSDGWTPLHCASSCNNLPIAKLLIENGACIFATSLSDSETPAQKCEEAIKATQDVVSPSSVYDKCYVYLEKVEQCIGLVNDGKVFAAFGYEAEKDDELSFDEGDVLKVLSRETGERGISGQHPYDFMYQIQLPLSEDCLWWTCENPKTGKKGLVPRNFLSLYPIWKHRPTDWQSFELPSTQQALDALLKQNSKSEDSDSKDTRRNSNSTLDPCDGDGSCSPDSSRGSDDVRVEDSPPPLPEPKEFDISMQISANA